MDIPDNVFHELRSLDYSMKKVEISDVKTGEDFNSLSEDTKNYLQSVPIIDYTNNPILTKSRFSEDNYYVIGKYKNKFLLIRTEGYTWARYATKLFNFSPVTVGY